MIAVDQWQFDAINLQEIGDQPQEIGVQGLQ